MMKTRMIGWRTLLAVAGACILMGSFAHGSRFDRIYSFGDSLSDAVNLGPLSNGPVWPQYLAGYLNLDLYDYAYKLARTGHEGPAMGFLDEVDLFLSEVAEKDITNRDLFTVVIGSSDFVAFHLGGGPNPYPDSVANTVSGVQSLMEAGARYMVVWTSPDLRYTPWANANLTPEEKDAGTMLIELYNGALVTALEDLASIYHCKLVIVEINVIMNDMITNPEDYGLINVTLPAKFTGLDPDTSIFWDWSLPTTYGHQLLAEYVLDTMLDELVPGKAIGLDRNVPGWVHH